jgi:hypothetical protein
MDGEYKKWDKSLYEKYDELGKKYASHFLPKILKLNNAEKYRNVEVKKNSDVYGPDLECYNDGKLIGYFEPEIKNNWDTQKFTFPDLQIPERKAKWVDGHKGLPVTFCILRKPVSEGSSARLSIQGMATVTGKNVASSPKQMVPNKYIPKGELFFKVPLHKVKFHDFDEVLKREITRGNEPD